MAFHFSANQYEDAFVGKKLRNYTLPRKYTERPKRYDGYTQFVANNRGHLLENVPRSKESPWGTFMGTWHMPLKIPPSRPSYTARSKPAADRLKYFKDTSTLNNARNGFRPFPCEKQMNVKDLVTPPPTFVRTPGPATQSQASNRSRAAGELQRSRPGSVKQVEAPVSPHLVEESFSPSAPILPSEKVVKIDLKPTHNSCPPSRMSATGSPTKLINEGMVQIATPRKMGAGGSRPVSGFSQGDPVVEVITSPAPINT